jgi:hypothetical protein
LPCALIFSGRSNFDVFNDTGTECHGFEIELDGISADKVVYTFGGTYERYGNPIVTNFAGGTFVRSQSPWDAVNMKFTQTTLMAPAVVTPTNGHACCTPVDKQNENPGAEAHAGHLMCYRVQLTVPPRPAPAQPKFVAHEVAVANTNFPDVRLFAKSVAELCVPAQKHPVS